MKGAGQSSSPPQVIVHLKEPAPASYGAHLASFGGLIPQRASLGAAATVQSLARNWFSATQVLTAIAGVHAAGSRGTIPCAFANHVLE